MILQIKRPSKLAKCVSCASRDDPGCEECKNLHYLCFLQTQGWFGKYGEHMHDWDYKAYMKELVEYKNGSKKDAKGKKIKKPKPARKSRPCTKEEQEIMEELL